MSEPKIYCFDIDGTLCSQMDGTHYDQAEPHPDIIACLNELYHAGHTIFLYTARGTKTGINWEGVTKDQLVRWGVKYHSLFFGKPYADVYIDDKAINIKDWMKLSEELL